MPKLAIIGRIEVASGCVEKVLPLLVAHGDRCLRDEPGTLHFEVLRPREEATAILIYEIYESDSAFDVHRNGASIARLRAEAGDMIVKISGTPCTLVERKSSPMTSSEPTDRYLRLVDKLERLEAEKRALTNEIQNMIEVMTEAEAQRVGENLRHGHEMARQALEAHIRQLHSPPVE
jgi:quinol monooxygenase YgiN